jgi:hypothetical protein
MRYGRVAVVALAALAGMTAAGLSWGRFEIGWEFARTKWHGPFKVKIA